MTEFLYLLLCLVCAFALELYCKDENGKNVDWFIMLKYPKLDNVSSGYDDGYTYYYLDANSYSSFKEGTTKLSNKSKGALAYTLNQIYDNKNNSNFGYAMYNDDAPDPYSDSSYRAHAKGVVAVDNTNKGYWLVHSTPRFPDDPSVASYSFPEYETTYGQSYICMSLNGSSMNAVGNILYYDMPNYYVKKIPSSLQSLYPDLYDAVMNDAHTTSASTTVQFLTFSLGKSSIKQVMALAKTKNWGLDFWDDLVAPTTESDLAVETWIRGGTLPPECGGAYKIVDVSEVKVGKYGWSETKDHSKYGITLRSSFGGSSDGTPWVCVGDINRMESQRERGGGAVCIQNSTLWGAFDDIIQEIVDC